MAKIYKHAAMKINAYLYAMMGIFRSAELLDTVLCSFEDYYEVDVKWAIELLLELVKKETAE